uniref:Uncharacterized protein n=1 Tax=Avena sativa TaxID=4498 RepID=A0ACD5YC70_AVESA
MASPLNKLVRPSDLWISSAHVLLVLHHRGGDKNEVAMVLVFVRSDGQKGVIAASMEIFWSSSSAAHHSRSSVVQLLTPMAEGQPLRALVPAVCWCYLTFFLPAGVPKGRILRSCAAAFNIAPVPSGVVPGDDEGGRGIKLICKSGGEGPDGVLLFLFRVFSIKVEDYNVFFHIFLLSFEVVLIESQKEEKPQTTMGEAVDRLVKETTAALSLTTTALSPPPPPSTAMPIFEGGVLLGYVDIFLPPPSSSSSGGGLVFGSSKEIRISRRSPASDRCPPLAVLQVIGPYSMRCKLTAQQQQPDDDPRRRRSLLLHTLHSTCLKQRMTAVVDAAGGEEELHLVAMQSKVKKGVPCFWCWSAQTGLYAACLWMLNQRCLAIVLDLDQTVVSSYNNNTFKALIEKIDSRLEDHESDAATQSTLRHQRSKVSEDHTFLKDFVDKRAITVDQQTVRTQDEKSMLYKPSGLRQVILRPVIRVPTRNAVLTCLDPMDPESSYFVNIRPGWDELKSCLINNSGCTRSYKVYVCTMAGRYYALEVWRLLDPQGSLINSEEISQRVICVRSDSKKSLQRVFRKSLCHPNLAMVIDDRMDVWDEKDKRRVHNLPAYNPTSVSPEDKVVHCPSVLQNVRSITRKVHKGFFSEFDGVLLKTVDELMYENDVLDLPYPPDVGDYLQLKNNKIKRHSDAPIYHPKMQVGLN